MKLRNYFYAILSGLAITAGFTSCSDDDDDWNWESEGSNIEMVKERAFILNEGSFGLNNSHLVYFDWKTDEPYSTDIYFAQNQQQIGDTGQDIIEYDGCIFMAIYNSNYIARLSSVGKELGRTSFVNHETIGKIRFLTANNGYIYASATTKDKKVSEIGYVVKINAKTLEIVDYVEVGRYPEQIIEENGYIYCVNSGWGNDNRLSVIDERTFKVVDNVEIFGNPQAIVETDGYIVIQGYGGPYGSYTYPVAVYDTKTKTYKEIGTGTNITAEDGILYVVNTTTDYDTTPYSGSTEVWSYNLHNGKKTENALQLPDDLKNKCTYGISINDETDHVYILATNYTWGNGDVYHFDNTGKYIGKFSSSGQNPKKIIFFD